MVDRLKFILDSLLFSYSTLLFSHSRLLGTFIIASTMLVPNHGILGLLGGIFSNSFAYFIGLDRQGIRKGILGYSGILIGLSLGSFYKINPQSIFLLLTISIVLVLTSVLINNLFFIYLGLSPMSLPFIIVNYILMAAILGLGNIHTDNLRLPIINLDSTFFPHWINIFFNTLGAIVYQPNLLAGIIIAAGLLIYSRIAFVLITSGFILGTLIHNFLGIDESLMESYYQGYNYMLTALAIGGVFAVCSFESFFLSIITIALSTIILIATYNTLQPTLLTPHGLPIVIPVLLVLYVLRNRFKPSMWIQFRTYDISSPEENLRRHNENIKKYKQWNIPLLLPFHGWWKVTQGVNGEYSHKNNLSFAYDFQAVDYQGNTYKNNGSKVEDYYSYGLPVLSPADGKIYIVKNDSIDNPIGKINTTDNWGNYVIIEHAPNYYSCIAHLKQGSLKVFPGQFIKKGEIIGLCGNSGRSAYPHIHIQVQNTTTIGTSSLYFEFSNFLLLNNRKNSKRFISSGTISEQSIVKNTNFLLDFNRFFPYSLNNEWVFQHKGHIESWKLCVDFYGNLYLTSSPKITKLYFQLYDGSLIFKTLEGSKETGLFLLGSLISELPFLQSESEIIWSSLENANHDISPIYKFFLDPLAIFSLMINKNSDYLIQTNEDEVHLKVTSYINLKTPLFSIPLKNGNYKEIIFKRDLGLKTIKVDNELHLQHVSLN